MGLSHSPSIVTDGLDFYVDPNNTRCYPGFGNTVYNIINSSIGATLVGFTSALLDSTEARSFFFDGSNDSLPFSNSTSYSPTKISVCIWFKKAHGSSFKALIDKGRDNYGAWTLCVDETANKATFKAKIFYTSGINQSITTSSNYNSNAWNFVCGVYDGAYLSIYLNGVLSNSAYYLHELGNNSYPITIGAANDGYNVNANIGQAFVYGRALSAAEIQQLYHATKKKYLIEENIVTNGLILNIDPGNRNSYSGVGNTIYNLTGLGNTGTLTNGPTFSGLSAGSFTFDGSNDFINFGNIGSVGNAQTIEVWFNSNSVTDYRNVFDMNNAGNKGPRLEQYSAGKMSWVWSASTNIGIYNITSQISILSNTWLHTVITLNSGNYNCYINGTLVESGNSVNGYTTSYNNATLGLGYETRYYSGNISQVKIYNRALSATEIQQNYNATKGRFLNALPPVRNGLILELDAANTSSYSGFGNTWYDLTGNGNNYTLTNGPVFSSFGTTQNFFFDGSNDRALAVNPISLGTTHTVSMIVRPNSVSEDGILFGDIGYSNTGYAFYLNSGNYLYYNAGSPFVGSATTTANNWYMFSVTRTNTSVSLYQNGALLTTATLGGNDSLTLRSIADFSAGGYPFAGNISQVSCYNRALSAYEIKQNFDFYRTRYGI